MCLGNDFLNWWHGYFHWRLILTICFMTGVRDSKATRTCRPLELQLRSVIAGIRTFAFSRGSSVEDPEYQAVLEGNRSSGVSGQRWKQHSILEAVTVQAPLAWPLLLSSSWLCKWCFIRIIIVLTLYLPWVTKTEFLLTISIQYQAGWWWD